MTIPKSLGVSASSWFYLGKAVGRFGKWMGGLLREWSDDEVQTAQPHFRHSGYWEGGEADEADEAMHFVNCCLHHLQILLLYFV